MMSEDAQPTDLFATDTEDGRDSPPQIPVDSPGSSVSSRLKDEYSQLLKYTIESTPGLNTILPLLEDTEKVQATIGDETKDRNDNNSASQDEEEETYESEDCRKTMVRINNSVSAMGGKLDGFLDVLKENVLDELKASLMSALRSQHGDHMNSLEGLQADKLAFQKEVNQLNEKLNSLELNVQQKCTVIKNLTDSLVAQKKKVEMAKHFFHWKADHHDKQREIFTEKLATQHHERKLNLRVLKAWYSVIQTRWRSRTERRSQTQAKEVCLSLTSDYEAKIAMLNQKISSLENKTSSLQAEREMYSDQVKKAFMRGMCALNMETMSVFGEEQLQQSQDFDDPTQEIQEVSTFDGCTMVSTTDDITGQSNNSHQLPPASSPTRLGRQQQQQRYEIELKSPHHSTGPCISKPVRITKAKPKSGKGPTTNKVVSSSQVLAPPMASVVVERHPPVNKQTMGKATAVRYPKKNVESVSVRVNTGSCVKYSGVGEMRFKPLAGQKDNRNDNSRIASDGYIKVVE